MSQKKRAFVAGATGFTGREVVRQLARGGIEAYGHVRPDSPKLGEWRAKFEADGAKADPTPWDLDALTARFRELRPDLVFGCLGTTRRRMSADAKRGISRAEADYDAVDYGLTKLLMDAAGRAGIRPRFVYLSAVGSGPNVMGAYMKARWKTEEALRASGLPYTIVRPAFIAGEGRDETRLFEKVGGAMFDGLLGVAGAAGAKKLAGRYRSITNVDLAGAMVRLALDPAAENTVAERERL